MTDPRYTMAPDCDEAIGAVAEAGPVLSNRLVHLAGTAGEANRTYRRSSAAVAAYVEAGRALSEARESAKRGEWAAVLSVAGIEERTARTTRRPRRCSATSGRGWIGSGRRTPGGGW